MQHKKPKLFNWRAMIRSHARRIWMWSPMRREAIRNARIPAKKGYVICAECGRHMKENAKPKEYDVDHIIPASEPSAEIHSFDDFFKRLYVPASEQRVLCKPCHAVKTSKENQTRRRKTKLKRRLVSRKKKHA
jgi:5-methylcytosine-specific restriction endonuclease McrA